MLSDRFGRRRVILLSNFGLGLDYIVMALAPDDRLAVRRPGDLGDHRRELHHRRRVHRGRHAEGEARLELRHPRSRVGARIRARARRSAAYSAPSNPRLPFWAAAGMTLLNALYGLLVLPESLPPEKRTPRFVWARANPLGSLELLRSHHELFGLASVNFLYYLAHQVLQSVMVLYVGYRYNWDARIRRAHARGDRHRKRDRAGRARAARRREDRRPACALHGLGLRHDRIRGLGARAHGSALSLGDPARIADGISTDPRRRD